MIPGSAIWSGSELYPDTCNPLEVASGVLYFECCGLSWRQAQLGVWVWVLD